MSDEIQAQNQQKNTVANVGMWFSISGLVSIILIILGIICLINGLILGVLLLFIGGVLGLLTCGYLNLLIGFVLGIIGLFYKPRGKARVAITIPLIIFAAIASLACYIWSSIKTPAMQFADWVKVEFENIDEETFDNERFNNIANEEFENIFSSINEEEFKSLLETNTGSNILEKGSYLIFGLLQQGFENSLQKYNDGYLPEIDSDKYIKIDVNEDDTDEDVTAENNSDKNKIDENLSEDNESNTNEEISEEENTPEEVRQENIEVFSESEKNDIEQIINILE